MTLSSLSSFFNKNSRIEIPIYQRSYVWDKSRLEDLISDIESIDIGDPDSYHFFGLFVFTRNSTHIELIDGQQRITSVLIFLNVISDYLEWINKEHYALSQKHKISYAKINIANYIYHDNNGVFKRKLFSLTESNSEDTILLQLIDSNDPDNARDFSDYMNNPRGYRESELKLKASTKKIDGRTLRHKKSYLAHLFFKNHFNIELQSKGIEEFIVYLRDLSKKILERLKVMDFEAASSSDAFKLFEVLNDRGVSVSSVDLLKNVCLQNGAFPAQIEKIHDKWTEIMHRTIEKPEEFIFFLRSSHNSRYEFIRKSEIYDKFKDQYENKTFAETMLKLDGELYIDARNFTIVTGNSQFGQQEVDNLINILRISGTKQAVPLLLSSLRVLNLYTALSVLKKVRTLIELVVETIVCMICNDIRFNKIEEELPKIARSIKNYTNQSEAEQKLEEAIAGLRLVMASNPSMCYSALKFEDVDSGITNGNNSPYKLLLLLLHYHTGMLISTEFKELEHVLPQKADNAYWTSRFSPSNITEYCYSIGNMLLLDKKINASVNNKGFDLKKVEYTSNRVQDLVRTPGLDYTSIKDWDEMVINERTLILKQMLHYKLNIIV